MSKLKFYSRIGLLFLGLITTSNSVFSQCTNASQYPSTAAIAPTSGSTQISTCSYQSEYSVIDNVQGNTIYINDYQLSGLSNGYITIHEGSATGPVVGFGPAPLTWTSTVTGSYYSHWSVDAACATATGCGTTSITFVSPASACSNPITAGSTVALPANACPMQNVALSLNGATLASGISYQWQSSTDGVTFTDIAGATNASYSTTQSSTMYYQCVLICSAGSTSTSTPVQVDMNPFYNCYCTTSNSTGTSACLQNVIFNTISNNTGGCSGAATFNYSSGNGNTNLIPGQSYTIDITCSTSAIVSVWIDFDQNGMYDASEWFQPFTSGTTGTLSIAVPATATLGTTGMRIRSRSSGSPNGATDPCTNFFSGETEDYTVTIGNPCNPISIVNPGDQSVCSPYTLPAIAEVTPSGNADLTMYYYDAPGGTGNIVTGPIASTQTIYAYGSSSGGACSDDQMFTITVGAPNTGVDSQFSCGPYTWINGVTYSTSNNTAQHTLTNASGCDSVVTLMLTVGAPSYATDVHVSCGPYTWIDGVTYTSSNNTATHTLTNAAGCDSIVTLNLTIPTATITAAGPTTFCQGNSVTLTSNSPIGNVWSNGLTTQSITVNNSGAYTVSITNAGCTMTSAPISITVNSLPTVGAGADQIACSGTSFTLSGTGASSYTWNNGVVDSQPFTPNSTQTYVVTGTNAAGCTNTDTVIITVNQPSYMTVIGSAINSYTINGQTYTATGLYTQTLQNSLGCDSIINIDLTMSYLGIDEASQVSYSVFPNPANDHITIQTEGIVSANYQLIDLQGRIVLEGKLTDNATFIDISTIEMGNYFIKIGEDIPKIKIVKQ